MKKKITITDLKNDPGIHPIIKRIESNHGGIVPAVINDAIVDISENSELIPKQIKQWVLNTAQVAERILDNQGSSSDYSICWIRIYEVIHSLSSHFSSAYLEKKEWHKSICDPSIKEHIEIGYKISDFLLDLKGRLSANELIVLEYIRNCNAHVFQKGYRIEVKLGENDKIEKSKTDYKQIPIQDVNNIIDQELRKHDYSDKKYLEFLLEKINLYLNEIKALMHLWSP